MFFIASKVFWLAVQPISLVLLLVLAGLVLMVWRRRRSAIAAVGLAALLQVVIGYTSFGYLLIQPLENRFAVPTEPPEDVAAIVLLGGATMARPSTARGITELNQAGDRLVTTLWLAQTYPGAQVILSGGSGLLTDDTESEAETMRRFFVSFGIGEERLFLEGDSRNTAENAAFIQRVLEGVDGPILLVTSAFHMPRAIGIFRQQGIETVAWPTDYRSAGNQGFGLDIANPNQNLETTSIALREWIGLLAYSLTGRTTELFPAP